MDIFCLWRVLRILHIFWIQAFCQIYDWQIFVISLSWYCPLKHESFKNFNDVQSVFLFFLLLLMLLMSYLRNHCLAWGCECFSSEFPNHWTCSGPWTVRNRLRAGDEQLPVLLFTCITAWIFCPIALVPPKPCLPLFPSAEKLSSVKAVPGAKKVETASLTFMFESLIHYWFNYCV